MDGQMMNDKRYLKSLENIPEPILLNQMPGKMSLKKVADYAREKGVEISSFSKEELKKFFV